MKNNLTKSGILSIIMVMGTGIGAFAEGSQSAAVTAALQTVASDITATITAIAPVALSIVGVFLVWRYGMKFFKALSK